MLILPSLSCVTPYPENALIEKILVPRQGYQGSLTNRFCKKHNGFECQEYEVKKYDLAVKDTRLSLRKLNFTCKINGKRYKICEENAGFCRTTYKKDCKFIFCKSKKVDEVLLMSDYEYLLNAKAVCFNEDRYDWNQF